MGGLTAKEIAAVLNVSPQTVHRDWSLAKAWLVHEMKQKGDHGPETLGKAIDANAAVLMARDSLHRFDELIAPEIAAISRLADVRWRCEGLGRRN